LEETIFENFNIAENNIISVKLAKVLRYQIMKWEDLLKEANFCGRNSIIF